MRDTHRNARKDFVNKVAIEEWERPGRTYRGQSQVAAPQVLDVAVTMTAGALIAVGRLLHDQPDRDVETTSDRVTEDLLRMFGLPRRQAHQICTRPLPQTDSDRGDGSAA